jgi:perosamine synthetase
MEPLFLKEIQNYPGVYQKYEKGLCPNSEFLQERMIQLKTNYWDLKEAKKQADILKKTLNEFEQ